MKMANKSTSKSATKSSTKTPKEKMDMVAYPYDGPYQERISVPFPLEDVGKLKIGQEVSITIKGTINHLEGEKHYSCIGLMINEKHFRITGNSQAEGIRKLVDDDEDHD